ncbi:TfoX/Sxy family protein [Allosphingosinicella flava]|uniref:TfoX/Sxy family protein n=1 Tax=Allosphingosinicella flava TaxID=2771430 RepID=A0A7T2LM65_9SPHN|nr:TfoX/Sxy family protein [Sphingosinicella flava]QPQ54742.1 TfoX/Sxy family protein [Sphingosinicella flava]
MSVDEGFVDWVREAVAPLGGLGVRKMMGGASLYIDGTIFAILDEGEIWFKADAESDALWDEEGCARFTVTMKDGKTGTMNYRRGPADVYDDADAMLRWARLGLEAGVRGAAKKKPKKRP